MTIMCEKMQNNNTDFRAAIQIVRRDPVLSKNFKEAADYLSEAVSSIFPAQDDRFPTRRKISGLESEDRGSGRGRGGRLPRGGGRGGRHGRGGFAGGRDGRFPGRPNRTTGADSSMCNGVDLRDIDQNFSPEEWRQLPNFVRDSIRNVCAQKKARRDEAQLRGVAAASTHNTTNDDSTSITGSQQTEITQNTAGRVFGRNAYQGRGGNRGGNHNDSS